MTKYLLFFRIMLFCLILFILFSSCARSLTPEQAAGGGYKKSRNVN